MIETPGFLWTVLFFILALAPLIFIHEMGHYLVARWCGIKAEVFSIGFGKRLFGWTDARGTDWRVCLVPLGGYVRFAGDMSPVSEPNDNWLQLPEAERSVTFQSKPLWQRALVVAAGPITNLLLAVLIFAGFALAFGKSVTPPVVQDVVAGSPAEKAGLTVGDTIMRINGSDIATFDEVSAMVQDRPGMLLKIDFERSGAAKTVEIVPAVRKERDRFGNEFRYGQLGIGSSKVERVDVGLFEAPIVGVQETISTLDRMIGGLWQIITGRRSVDELGGPIKIAQVSGQVATMGWLAFLNFVALISINLGFINLLPIPMLDGGHLTFYALEAIRRKPTSPRVMEYAFRSGLALVFGLMVFTTLNDLGSLGVWSRISGFFG
jgi:regulator of sigma E protease